MLATLFASETFCFESYLNGLDIEEDPRDTSQQLLVSNSVQIVNPSSRQRQWRTQRQHPRTGAHVHRLVELGQLPILAVRVPVRQVTVGQIERHGALLARLEGDLFEAAEDACRFGWVTEGDILRCVSFAYNRNSFSDNTYQLRDFRSEHATGIGQCRRDLV